MVHQWNVFRFCAKCLEYPALLMLAGTLPYPALLWALCATNQMNWTHFYMYKITTCQQLPCQMKCVAANWWHFTPLWQIGHSILEFVLWKSLYWSRRSAHWGVLFSGLKIPWFSVQFTMVNVVCFVSGIYAVSMLWTLATALIKVMCVCSVFSVMHSQVGFHVCVLFLPVLWYCSWRDCCYHSTNTWTPSTDLFSILNSIVYGQDWLLIDCQCICGFLTLEFGSVMVHYMVYAFLFVCVCVFVV